jgi:hypothetical protein
MTRSTGKNGFLVTLGAVNDDVKGSLRIVHASPWVTSFLDLLDHTSDSTVQEIIEG